MGLIFVSVQFGIAIYAYFDFESFSAKKKFMYIGKQPWRDFNSGEIIGSKIEAVIMLDKTDYGEADVNNLYEKITFKVPKNLDIPLQAEIRPINPIATVYGEYRNQLSVTADDIQIVTK